jgi:hypothetical protein
MIRLNPQRVVARRILAMIPDRVFVGLIARAPDVSYGCSYQLINTLYHRACQIAHADEIATAISQDQRGMPPLESVTNGQGL